MVLRRRRPLVLAGLCLVVMVSGCATPEGGEGTGPVASAARSLHPPPAVGQLAPEFSGKDTQGAHHDLSRLRGKVVVLGFISPGIVRRDAWSEDSRRQLVMLRSMDTQYRARGATTVAVDADGTAGDRNNELANNELVNFAIDHDLTFPLLVGAGGNATVASYGVRRAPAVVIIDAQGRVAARWDGVAPAPSMASVLETLCPPLADVP